MSSDAFHDPLNIVFAAIFVVLALAFPFLARQHGLFTIGGRRLYPASTPKAYGGYAALVTTALLGIAWLFAIENAYRSAAANAVIAVLAFGQARYFQHHPEYRSPEAVKGLPTSGSFAFPIMFGGFSVFQFTVATVIAFRH